MGPSESGAKHTRATKARKAADDLVDALNAADTLYVGEHAIEALLDDQDDGFVDELPAVHQFFLRFRRTRFAPDLVRAFARDMYEARPPSPAAWRALELIEAGCAYLAGQPTWTAADMDAAFAGLHATKMATIDTATHLGFIARRILATVDVRTNAGDHRDHREAAQRMLTSFAREAAGFARVDANWFADELLARYSRRRRQNHVTLDVIVARLCARAKVYGFDETRDPEVMRKRVARVCSRAQRAHDDERAAVDARIRGRVARIVARRKMLKAAERR